MAQGLPEMLYNDGITKRKQVSFGGYNHTLGAENGEIWDMENMTGDFYPLLSPRRRRAHCRSLNKPWGLYAHDGLYWVDGTGFYADGKKKGTVTEGRKRFASLGAYIVILPDKKYYNRLTGEFGAIETQWSGSARIQDGTYVEEKAKANTIYAAGANWGALFKQGDAVTISGAKTHGENNKTAVIREISGDYLRFYENAFTINSGGDRETLTVKRGIPDMDYICENENRLWGCKGDTIYASKLGDIFNWNVFDGIATDSYAVNVASTGDFTACCSFMGYPCFFKEEHIYKVYGDKPSNFQVMGSASMGVAKGSGESLAIAGETLFYLSRTGITAWTGGIPQSVSAGFGVQKFKNAVGGSDGIKYYVSMQDAEMKWHLFVFDTRSGLWHREDGTEAVGWGYDNGLYCLDKSGLMWRNGDEERAEGEMEPPVNWGVEWADFYEYDTHSGTGTATPEKKGIGKLLIRLELYEGAEVTIEMQFDSDGIWREVKRLKTNVKRSYYLPIIPRRCDHFRIRLSGTGDCKLYSLTREVYNGSEI